MRWSRGRRFGRRSRGARGALRGAAGGPQAAGPRGDARGCHPPRCGCCRVGPRGRRGGVRGGPEVGRGAARCPVPGRGRSCVGSRGEGARGCSAPRRSTARCPSGRHPASTPAGGRGGGQGGGHRGLKPRSHPRAGPRRDAASSLPSAQVGQGLVAAPPPPRSCSLTGTPPCRAAPPPAPSALPSATQRPAAPPFLLPKIPRDARAGPSPSPGFPVSLFTGASASTPRETSEPGEGTEVRAPPLPGLQDPPPSIWGPCCCSRTPAAGPGACRPHRGAHRPPPDPWAPATLCG